MTKTEERILEHVRQANALGALAGLDMNRDGKFIQRLQRAGKIQYVQWTPEKGAGWKLCA